jgi:hypothetical protein
MLGVIPQGHMNISMMIVGNRSEHYGTPTWGAGADGHYALAPSIWVGALFDEILERRVAYGIANHTPGRQLRIVCYQGSQGTPPPSFACWRDNYTLPPLNTTPVPPPEPEPEIDVEVVLDTSEALPPLENPPTLYDHINGDD